MESKPYQKPFNLRSILQQRIPQPPHLLITHNPPRSLQTPHQPLPIHTHMHALARIKHRSRFRGVPFKCCERGYVGATDGGLPEEFEAVVWRRGELLGGLGMVSEEGGDC